MFPKHIVNDRVSLAYNLVDMIIEVQAKMPPILVRMKDLSGRSWFMRYHFRKLAEDIESHKSGLKTFCNAARRQNVRALAKFIGYDKLEWLEKRARWAAATLSTYDRYLSGVEDLNDSSLIKMFKPVRLFAKELRVVEECMSDVDTWWLSRKAQVGNTHPSDQPVDLASIWHTAVMALRSLSHEDSAWTTVKSELFRWGKSRSYFTPTLDRMLKHEEARDSTRWTVISGLTWIVFYAGTSIQVHLVPLAECFTDLELQRQAHAYGFDEAAYACRYYHEKLQALLDSDILWIQGMHAWSLIMRPYFWADIDPLLTHQPKSPEPLNAVQGATDMLISMIPHLCLLETRLPEQEPELNQRGSNTPRVETDSGDNELEETTGMCHSTQVSGRSRVVEDYDLYRSIFVCSESPDEDLELRARSSCKKSMLQLRNVMC